MSITRVLILTFLCFVAKSAFSDVDMKQHREFALAGNWVTESTAKCVDERGGRVFSGDGLAIQVFIREGIFSISAAEDTFIKRSRAGTEGQACWSANLFDANDGWMSWHCDGEFQPQTNPAKKLTMSNDQSTLVVETQKPNGKSTEIYRSCRSQLFVPNGYCETKSYDAILKQDFSFDHAPCEFRVRSCKSKNGGEYCIHDFYWPSRAKTVVETQNGVAFQINGKSIGGQSKRYSSNCMLNTGNNRYFCYTKDEDIELLRLPSGEPGSLAGKIFEKNVAQENRSQCDQVLIQSLQSIHANCVPILRKRVANMSEGFPKKRLAARLNELEALHPNANVANDEQTGFCRLSKFSTAADLQIGACSKQNFGESSGTKAVKFEWDSGIKTEIISRDGTVLGALQIDGERAFVNQNMQMAAEVSDDPDCTGYLNSDRLFCFSKTGFKRQNEVVQQQDVYALNDRELEFKGQIMEQFRVRGILSSLSETVVEKSVDYWVQMLASHAAKGWLSSFEFMVAQPVKSANLIVGQIADDIVQAPTAAAMISVFVLDKMVEATADAAYTIVLEDGNPIGAGISRQSIRYVGAAVNASFVAASSGTTSALVFLTIDQLDYIISDITEAYEVNQSIASMRVNEALQQAHLELAVASGIRLGVIRKFEGVKPELFDGFARSTLQLEFGIDEGNAMFLVFRAAQEGRIRALRGEFAEARSVLIDAIGVSSSLSDPTRVIAQDVLLQYLQFVNKRQGSNKDVEELIPEESKVEPVEPESSSEPMLPIDTKDGLKAYIKKEVTDHAAGFWVSSNPAGFDERIWGKNADCWTMVKRLLWQYRMMHDAGLIRFKAIANETVAGLHARKECTLAFDASNMSALRALAKTQSGSNYYFRLNRQKVFAFNSITIGPGVSLGGQECPLYAEFVVKNLGFTEFGNKFKKHIPTYQLDKLNANETRGSFCGRLNEDGTVTTFKFDTT